MVKIQKKTLKRIVSLLLCVTLVITGLPVSFINAVADEICGNQVVDEVVEETSQEENLIKEGTITELEELRDEYSKTFEHADGSRTTVISSVPIHYSDEESGKWEDIDNTLTQIVDENGNSVYANEKNDFRVSLPVNADKEKGVTVEKDGYYLAFKLLDVKNTKGKTNNGNKKDKENNKKTIEEHIESLELTKELFYEEMYENTDVLYEVTGKALKESILLNDMPKNKVKYQYEIYTEDLVAKLNDDKTISFYPNNKEDEVIFRLPAPYMTDADGEYSEDIEVKLQKKKDNYLLTYTPSIKWLKDENRSYPVNIDPTIQSAQSTGSIIDTYTSSGSTGGNYGSGSLLYTGTNTNGYINDTYVRVSPSGSIPAEAIIIDAKLCLTVGSVPYDISTVVYGVNSSWTEDGVTYANAPTVTSDALDYQRIKANSYGSTVEYNVTKKVNEWYRKTSTNYGFKISRETSASPGTYVNFFSSEYASYTKAEYAPYMTITYRSASGQNESERSIDMGKSGVAYINDNLGNLTIIREDIGVDGNVMPVNIKMIYNSLNPQSGNMQATGSSCPAGYDYIYGYGWRTNYSEHITYTNTTVNGVEKDYYKFISENGKIIYFEREIAQEDIIAGETDMSTVFIDSEGMGYTLTVDSSNYSDYTLLCITDSSNYKHYYDSLGRLVKIVGDMPVTKNVTSTSEPVSGNYEPGVIKIEYVTGTNANTMMIDTITDGAGRVYQFNYNGALLTSIEFLGTDSVTDKKVTYNISNPLFYSQQLGVSYGEGRSISYEYSSPNSYVYYLSVMTDTDNSKVTFENNGIISNVKIYDAEGNIYQNLDVTREVGSTAYEESITGAKEILQFDSYGNVIAVRDEEGNAIFNKYSKEDSDIPNELLGASGLEKTSINILSESYSYSNAVKGDSDTYYYKPTSVVKTNPAGAFMAMPSVTEGQDYTVSAFVKTSGMSNDELGAYIRVFSYMGTLIDQYTEVIDTDTEWKRLFITFKATTPYLRIYFQNSSNTGTAWFDGIQLEKGNLGSYNLVTNADFANGTAGALPTGWTYGTGTSASSMYLAPSGNFPAGTKNCLLAKGRTTDPRQIYQQINISGKEGDKYSFGGWAKSCAAPSGSCGIAVEVHRAEGVDTTTHTEDKVYTVDFNAFTSDWQYAMEGFTTEYDYDYLKIYVIYDNQVNTTLFDGIQLYREALYSEYEYVEEESSVSGEESDESETDSEITMDVDDVFVFDEYERLIESISDENIVKNTSYDVFSNEVTSSTTNATQEILTSTTYTSDGSYILSQTDEAGNTVTYGYDTLGNLISVINQLGNKTTYTYDSNGNVTGNSLDVSGLTNGTAISNSFSYDSGDRLTSITHNGFSYDFEYDSLGTLTGVSSPFGKIISYNYGTVADGYNLESVTYGNGQTIEYEYDSLGVLTKVLFDDELIFRYVYDINTENRVLYDYVNNIMKSSITGSNDEKVVIEEGINGNDAYHSYYTSTDTSEVTATRPVTGTEYTKYNSTSVFHETIGSKLFETTYTSDGDGRLIGSLWSNDNGNKNLAITYDDLNRKSQTTLKSNSAVILNTVCDYKDVSATKTTNFIETIRFSNDNGYSKSLSYTYDANGNITNASGVTYVYDEAGQLIRVNDPANGTTTFQYDKGGNLVYEKTYAYTTGTLGNVTSTKNYSYQYDRLVSVTENGTTTSITYDVSGNSLNYYNGMSFQWEMGRQLAGITNGNTTISYTYNEDGIRTSKTVNGVTTEYTLVDGRITYQTDGNTSMYFRYDGNDELIGFEYTVNGVTNEYYYVKNLQGDIIDILDNNGNVVVSYEYDAWGEILSVSGSLASTVGQANPFRYRSYYYDNESGFYYLQSRYYDAGVRRFINADDVNILEVSEEVLHNNMYIYCENNSVNKIDNNGKWSIALTVFSLICLSYVAVVTISVINNPAFQQSWKDLCSVIGNSVLTGLKAINGINSLARAYLSAKTKAIAKSIWDSYSRAKSIPKYKSDGEWHHVVAKMAKNAKRARDIINEVGIGYQSPKNLIYIKTGLHRRLHTDAYYGWANSVVISAYNAAGDKRYVQRNSVIAALEVIKKFIEKMDEIAPF